MGRGRFGRTNTRSRGLDYDIKCVRVMLLHNPKAGRGEYSKNKLTRAFRKAGHQVRYRSTKGRGWKRSIKDSKELIVVAGGDGTVGKVAHQLIGRSKPLTILPIGTANNLARSLGFTGSVQELIDQIAAGKAVEFDIGVATGPWGRRYFFEAAGAGVLAEYLRLPRPDKGDLSREEEMTWHVVRMLRLLRSYRPFKSRLSVDGRRREGSFLMLEAMNVTSAGPALKLAPRARTGDGQLDLILVRKGDRERLIEYLGQRVRGKSVAATRLPVVHFRKLTIESFRRPFHIDSEPWPGKGEKPSGPLKVELEIEKSALLIHRKVKC